QGVVEGVCAQLVLWSARPHLAHLTLAMNVSTREFRHRDFVSRLLGVIDVLAVDPRRLVLEVTESLLVDDMEGTIAELKQLRARGVRVSLDDFGTGYSSL